MVSLAGDGRDKDGHTVWTIPNFVSVLRLVGLVPLLWVAWQGHRGVLVWIMVALLVSDWVDGKLAIILGQRTTLGARFDSAVDAAMYAAIALSLWWLEGEMILAYLGWILVAVGTWLASVAVAFHRFGRMPSYHTWAAKASWLVVGGSAVHVLLSGRATTIPWALGLVVATNVEAVGVGLLLPEWKADVRSAFRALRLRRKAEEGEGDEGAKTDTTENRGDS